MNHSFSVEIANKIGIFPAVVFEHLRFLCAKNAADGRFYFEGRYWDHSSPRAMAKLYPYASEKTIRRAVDKLISSGLVVKGIFNPDPFDRSLWLSVNEPEKNEINHDPSCPNCPEEPSPNCPAPTGHGRGLQVDNMSTCTLYNKKQDKYINSPLERSPQRGEHAQNIQAGQNVQPPQPSTAQEPAPSSPATEDQTAPAPSTPSNPSTPEATVYDPNTPPAPSEPHHYRISQETCPNMPPDLDLDAAADRLRRAIFGEDDGDVKPRRGRRPNPETKKPRAVRAVAHNPPTVSEVSDYLASRGLPTAEAEAIVDYYTANGWRCGRVAMVDWRAAARRWVRQSTGARVNAPRVARAPIPTVPTYHEPGYLDSLDQMPF